MFVWILINNISDRPQLVIHDTFDYDLPSNSTSNADMNMCKLSSFAHGSSSNRRGILVKSAVDFF